VLRAVEEHTEGLGRGRSDTSNANADPDLVGALFGLRGGNLPGPAPPDVADAVDTLFSLSARPGTG
jgi:hypothetical protein